MSVLSAFKSGTARIWLHKRLVLWLYLLNLAFAAVLVFPLRKIVSQISKSDLADDFVSGFPMETGFEFWSQHSLEFKSLGLAAAGLGVLYLLVNIFLAGGIVAALAVERRISFRRFLNDSSRYFGRYFRLFILLGIVMGLAVAGYDAWLSDLVDDLQKEATTGRDSFLWRCLFVGGLFIILTFTLMVFDYAKIRTVVERRRSVFLATLFALGFSLRRIWRTVPLFGLNLVIVGILFALYLLVENQLSNATVVSAVILFVVQQIFIVGRIWMRLSFFSTQMAYFRGPPAAPAPEVPQGYQPADKPSPVPSVAGPSLPSVSGPSMPSVAGPPSPSVASESP